MAGKSKYAKIGEQVKVITPLVFKRCGYPLTLQDVSEKFREEILILLNKLTEVLRDEPCGLSEPLILDEVDVGSYKKTLPVDPFVKKALTRAICGSILRREKFGGNQRQVYEYPIDFVSDYPIDGKTGTVVRKRIVKTGEYSPAYGGGGGWYGESEWEPAELYNQETLCIYTIKFVTSAGMEYLRDIMARNCERLQSNPKEEICLKK